MTKSVLQIRENLQKTAKHLPRTHRDPAENLLEPAKNPPYELQANNYFLLGFP